MSFATTILKHSQKTISIYQRVYVGGTCMHACACMNARACVHVCMYVHAYVHVWVCARACVCVCVCVCVWKGEDIAL